SREAACNRAIKIGPRECVLESPRDAGTLQLLHVEHKFGAARTRGVEVDRHEDARDRDLMVLERVAPGVQVSIQFEAHARMQFLRPSYLVIVLAVGTHVAYALV